MTHHHTQTRNNDTAAHRALFHCDPIAKAFSSHAHTNHTHTLSFFKIKKKTPFMWYLTKYLNSEWTYLRCQGKSTHFSSRDTTVWWAIVLYTTSNRPFNTTSICGLFVGYLGSIVLHAVNYSAGISEQQTWLSSDSHESCSPPLRFSFLLTLISFTSSVFTHTLAK